MELISQGNLHTIMHGERKLILTDRISYLRKGREVVPGRIEVSEGEKQHAAVDYEHIYDEKPQTPLGARI